MRSAWTGWHIVYLMNWGSAPDRCWKTLEKVCWSRRSYVNSRTPYRYMEAITTSLDLWMRWNPWCRRSFSIISSRIRSMRSWSRFRRIALLQVKCRISDTFTKNLKHLQVNAILWQNSWWNCWPDMLASLNLCVAVRCILMGLPDLRRYSLNLLRSWWPVRMIWPFPLH